MRLISLLCTILLYNTVSATVFYVDPANGNSTNDGSYNSPWPSVQFLLDNGLVESRKPGSKPYKYGDPLVPRNMGSPVKGGDTIRCFSGYQGTLTINNFYNTDYIHIEPVLGHVVEFERIHFYASGYWSVDQVVVSPSFGNTLGGSLINLETHSFHGPVQHVKVSNSQCFSAWDHYNWSAADWANNASSGMKNRSSAAPVYYCESINNYFRNVSIGVSFSGTNCSAIGNTIENFSNDAMRVFGNDMTFNYNLVMNCYKIDGNHDDFLQSFSNNVPLPQPFERVEIIGNTFLLSADLNQPAAFIDDCQGMFLSDGAQKDWVIMNNVIDSKTYWGIVIAGGENCIISNNTVVNSYGGFAPRIKMSSNQSTNQGNTTNILVNNISNGFFENNSGLESNNIQLGLSDYSQHFVDHQNNNYRLLPTSSLIDAGIATGAPTYDQDNQARPIGSGYDIGAFEYCAGQNCTVQPCQVNAGTGTNYVLCDTSAVGALDLFTLLSGNPQPTGTWTDIDGTGALSGSTLNLQVLTAGTYSFQYLVTESCGSDSTEVIVQINSCNPPNCAVFTPVLDSIQEAGWSDLPRMYPRIPLTGTIANRDDLSGFYKVTWDNAYIYFLIDVRDDRLVNDQSNSFVHDDGVSIYIDGGNEKATSYDLNDHNFTFRWNDVNIRHNNALNPSGVIKEETQTAGGYALEIQIPWSLIGIAPSQGHTIGLDLHINDDDDGGNRDKKLSWFGAVDDAWMNPSVLGDYTLSDPCVNRRVEMEVKAVLEGTFDQATSLMKQDLYTRNVLPNHHPYQVLPWNYNGSEGMGWSLSDYPQQTVDWVLVSLRSSTDPNTELGKNAAVLLLDGSIASFTIGLRPGISEVYVVIEHHNHLPVMSAMPVQITNDKLIFNFSLAESYVNNSSGQKLIGSTYCLFAGNGKQDDTESRDINGKDRISWQNFNGMFGQYLFSDFNLDGDVSALDKILWDSNNGRFTGVDP